MDGTKMSGRSKGLRLSWVPVRDAHGRVHLEARWHDGSELASGTTRRGAHAA